MNLGNVSTQRKCGASQPKKECLLPVPKPLPRFIPTLVHRLTFMSPFSGGHQTIYKTHLEGKAHRGWWLRAKKPKRGEGRVKAAIPNMESQDMNFKWSRYFLKVSNNLNLKPDPVLPFPWGFPCPLSRITIFSHSTFPTPNPLQNSYCTCFLQHSLNT